MNESGPYLNDDVYEAKYTSFGGTHDQRAIRDSKDEEYFENEEHLRYGNGKSMAMIT